MITPRRRKRDSFLPWLYLLADAAVVTGTLHLVFWVRFSSRAFPSNLSPLDYPVYYQGFNFIALILVFFLRFYGLYQPNRIPTLLEETVRVLKAVVSSTLVFMAITFFLRGFSYSRTFLVAAGAALALGVCLGRYLLGLVVMGVDERRGSRRHLLIVGCDESAEKLLQFYRMNRRLATRVCGFLDDRRVAGSMFHGVPVLGRTQELGELIRKQRDIHEVVLATQGLSGDEVLQVISACEKELITFRWISDIFGLVASRMSVSYQAGVPLLSFTDSPLGDWENRVLKRAMDVSLSFIALVILSPLMTLVAFLVKLDSKGPVFYRQHRIGEDGRRFVLLKFRTMRTNAERESGPVWASANDQRRTRVGAILRRNNLDELPQLWNVLKGDMSLVGPRPERPFFVSQFREDVPRYMARHAIRSGITGWAQVNGLRGNTSIEERTKLDLYYIENWSLLFDLKILFLTLLRARENAY